MTAIGCLVLALGPEPQVQAQDKTQDKTHEIAEKLTGFDAYMEQLLKDWNAPGVGVGIVVDDKLVFAKGYGYRPRERIGVIVLVIGDHCASLYDIVSYYLYERLLGLEPTPWSERWLEVRVQGKKAGTEARAKADAARVADTHPSHPLADYVGNYEHPAYGVVKIGLTDGQLQFDFHKFHLPLTHFHYDRFDTPDDEQDGKWSVNFVTDPQGAVDKAVMSLDEAEAVFTRKPEPLDPRRLTQLAGAYETPTGFTFQVVLKEEDGSLYVVFPGWPDEKLILYKGLTFRVQEFSDVVLEFVEENGQITAVKRRDPAGEYIFTRK
jgi:hypothetical protein